MAEKVKVEFELKLGEKGIHAALTVPGEPVPARRMLPLFQGLADQVVGVAVAEVEQAGREVSCKAGCGACCRQVVPLSRTEAHQIRALVDAMPEPRRVQIRRRFADGVARLEAAGLLDEVRGFDLLPETPFHALHWRYLALRIPCPFLEDEACSIHPHRPLICREYLVTSSPEHCVDATPGAVRLVQMPALVSFGVLKLEGTDASDSRVALSLALEWTDAHADTEDQQLRPPVEWIDMMLEGMTGAPTRKE